MTLQKGDIEHLANLARISVKEEEKDELINRIESVLSYVGEISKVDTTGYTHAESGANRNVLRDDEAFSADEAVRNEIMNNAPEKHDGFVKVQKMIG